MNHEIMMYAIAQKEGLGLDKAVEECSASMPATTTDAALLPTLAPLCAAEYRMSRYGVTPNMMVIPPQLALYMSLAPEEKVSYAVAGPKADATFEAGAAGFTARGFRGCGIFTSEPFEVSDDQDSVQMLTRSSQVGEFYVMMPPQTEPRDGDGRHTADLLIYDEESDKHVRISWDDAVEATMIGAATQTKAQAKLVGKIGVETASNTAIPLSDNMNLKEWREAATKISAYNKGKVGATAAPLYSTLDGKTLDCRIVLARPFIEHLMHSAILAVSGRSTGATLFGPSDMQLSANTQVKTIEGHYTGHFKSVVTNPKNVLVMRDISCSGYVAGGNCKFFATGKASGAAAGEGKTDVCRDNMMKRLAFADDVGAPYDSMLAFPADAGQFVNGALDTVMSITSRLLPWEVQSATRANRHNSFPGGEEMYKVYAEALQLHTIHFGEDLKAAENMEFISQGSTNNALCFTGPHRRYDPFAKGFYSLEPGQGHFGPDAIPGDARWRRGESVSLKTARDSMVSIELASQAQMIYQKK